MTDEAKQTVAIVVLLILITLLALMYWDAASH